MYRHSLSSKIFQITHVDDFSFCFAIADVSAVPLINSKFCSNIYYVMRRLDLIGFRSLLMCGTGAGAEAGAGAGACAAAGAGP